MNHRQTLIQQVLLGLNGPGEKGDHCHWIQAQALKLIHQLGLEAQIHNDQHPLDRITAEDLMATLEQALALIEAKL